MMSASNLHNGPKSDIVRGPKSAKNRKSPGGTAIERSLRK